MTPKEDKEPQKKGANALIGGSHGLERRRERESLKTPSRKKKERKGCGNEGGGLSQCSDAGFPRKKTA